MMWQYLASSVQKPDPAVRSERFCLHPCPLAVHVCSGTCLLCSPCPQLFTQLWHRHCTVRVTVGLPHPETDFLLFPLALYPQHYCILYFFSFASKALVFQLE